MFSSAVGRGINNKQSYQQVETDEQHHNDDNKVGRERRRRFSKPPYYHSSSSSRITPLQEEEEDTSTTTTTTTTTINGDSTKPKPDTTDATMTTLRRLLDLAKPERHLMIVSAITMAFGSAVSLAVPTFSGQIIDLSIGASSDDDNNNNSSPFQLLLRLLGIMTVASIFGFFRMVWQAQAGHLLVARLRRHLYAGILSQDASYFDSMNQGDLLSRLSSDADLVQSAMTDQALGLMRNTVISIGAVGLLFYTSTLLALISVSILPPIAVCARMVGRKIKDRQTKVRELHASATSLAEQALTCIKTVQQYVYESYESQQYNTAINQAHAEGIQTAKLKAIFGSVMGLAVNLALLCVLGYGGMLVSQGALSPGDLASFVMYSVMMGGNISSISTQYMDLMKAVAAANRVFEIIDRIPNIPAPPGLLLLQEPSSLSGNNNGTLEPKVSDDENDDDMTRTTAATSSFEIDSPYSSSLEMMEVGGEGTSTVSTTTISADGVLQYVSSSSSPSPSSQNRPMAVDFQNVTFSYPTRPDSTILNQLNLSIQPGQMVALVGGSGGGKSTIASLLTRLYDPQEGLVLLNNVPITQMDPEEVRRNVGIVVQEPLLFPTTIEANIRYGSPNATLSQVRDAARLAFVLDFADKFPDGLQTVVGPRGTQLSGGQKQRVAVARCILKNPPIVVFDEATSALDAESESQVQKAIDIACKGRTVIMIAHRLSTIRNVDKIAVLKEGKVVEMGSFEELMTTKKTNIDSATNGGGAFRQLMDKQLLMEENRIID